MWGRWITRCGGTRKRLWTVRSVPLLQEVVSYTVKKYCYKIGKKCILEDNYLHHRDDVLLAMHQVLHHLLMMLQCFLSLVIPILAVLTGRGSGGRTSLSGIAPTVHPVAKSKPAIKVSIINWQYLTKTIIDVFTYLPCGVPPPAAYTASTLKGTDLGR
jgi:hypothetical protein